MCDPKKQITIDKFKGKAIGKDLLDCYFQYVTETEDSLSFFNRNGEEKASNLHKGSEFTFPHDNKSWTLTMETVSCETVAGRWRDGDNWEPDQSYQAQAGGTVPDEENAAAANA
ncbi:MAG TPA: hypothetical protein VKB05_11725 [Pyrinomonadaceae bacterium]|nr:hypothetical protein [Pyrinomonadaceae bacterium]